MKASMILKMVAVAIAFINTQGQEYDGKPPAFMADTERRDGYATEYAKDYAKDFAEENGYGLKKAFKNFEGLKAAGKDAVAEALATAGIATEDARSAFYLAKAAGINLKVVENEAFLTLLEDALMAGTIDPEIAQDAIEELTVKLNKARDKLNDKEARSARKELKKEERRGRKEDKRAGKAAKKLYRSGKKALTQGAHQASAEAAKEALAAAGIDVDNIKGRGYDKYAEDAGLDLQAIKDGAARSFVQAGVEDGTITAEDAQEFFEELQERAEKKRLGEEMEDKISSAVAESLDIAPDILANLNNSGKTGRKELKQMIQDAGVDLDLIKAVAIDDFLTAAVENGDISEEEAAGIREREDNNKNRKQQYKQQWKENKGQAKEAWKQSKPDGKPDREEKEAGREEWKNLKKEQRNDWKSGKRQDKEDDKMAKRDARQNQKEEDKQRRRDDKRAQRSGN